MNRLFILLCIVLAACSPKKQPPPPAVDARALQQQLEHIRQQIVATDSTSRLTALYNRQAALAQQAGDWLHFGSSHLELYNLLSDSLTATPHLDTLIALEDILRRLPAGRGLLATAYGKRYYEYEQRELNHKVVADCEKYLQYSNASLDSQYLSYVLRAAGIAWAKIGDQQQSVAYLERLLQWVSTTEDHESVAAAAINLANSYLNNGQASAAIATTQKALGLTGVSAPRRSYLNAVLAQVYYKQQDIGRARRYAEAALQLLPANSTDAEILQRLSVLQKVKADVLAAQQQPLPAVQACRASLACLLRAQGTLSGRDAGKTCIGLARLYRGLQQPDSALAYCNLALRSVCDTLTGVGMNVLPAPQALYPENTIMEALDEKAQVLQQLYELKKDTATATTALQCLLYAFEVEQQLRQHYIFDNSKYNQAEESRSRSEKAIALCLLLHRHTGGNQWLQKAFLFAEKSKSNVLLDKVRENLLAGGSRDTAFAKARELQLMIGRLDDQLRQAVNDSALTAALTAEKQQLSSAYTQNKSSINEKLNQVFSGYAAPDNETAFYSKKLNGHTSAVVAYFMGGSTLYGFLLNPASNSVSYIALPASSITQQISTLLPYLKEANAYNNNPAEYNRLSVALYRQLLQPLLTKQAALPSNMIVIPDGLLSALPFGALQSGGAASFLAKETNFVYAFSCASLVQQMERPVKKQEYELAFLAPFMEQPLRKLPSLPQSKKELAAVQAYTPQSFIAVNNAAGSAAFNRAAVSAGMLHIASHAFATASDSATPVIEMADGSVSLNSIYGLNLNNQLVVLSACHTGVGSLLKSEGTLSLARGFYYAGARNVINSLWEANDESTGRLFEQFYAALSKDKNIGRALHQAQLAYLNTAAPEKQSPYYWASFVCIGDGGFSAPAGKRFSNLFIAMIAGVILLLLALLWRMKKKRQRRNWV
jgi:CHAT domain-containing protein